MPMTSATQQADSPPTSRAFQAMRQIEQTLACMTPEERKQFDAEQAHFEKQVRWAIAGYPEAGPDSVSPDEPLTKVCTKCGELWPLRDYKPRPRGRYGRESWCRQCVNRQERLRRARKRLGAVLEMGRRIKHGTPPERVRNVVAALVNRMGGAEAVARELDKLFKQPRRSRDRKFVLRLLMQMIGSMK